MENKFKEVCNALKNSAYSNTKIRSILMDYKEMLSSMPIFGQRKEKKELTNILAKKGLISEIIAKNSILYGIQKWKTLIDSLKPTLTELRTRLKNGLEELEKQQTNIEVEILDLENENDTTSENYNSLQEKNKITNGKIKYFKKVILSMGQYITNPDAKNKETMEKGLETLLWARFIKSEILPPQFKNLKPKKNKI